MHWHLIGIVSLFIVAKVESGCSNNNANVRLVGGSVDGVGRLEIRRNFDTWGSVCMDSWKPVNSLVVCRQLCGEGNDAETISANNLAGTIPPIQFTDVRCIGSERSITECQMLEDWNIRCRSRNRVGVSCVKRACSGGGLSMQLGISAGCEPSGMVTFVNKTTNGGLIDSFALSSHVDPTCTDSQPGSNGTHLWLRLPYSKCDQLVAENSTWKSFETRFRIAALSGGPVVSTLTEYILPVKCAVNKLTNEVIHIVGNATSGQTDLLDSIEIGVKLTLNIRVFLDPDYTLPLQFPARDLPIGTLLFVRLELDPKQLPVNGTKLYVNDCVGMPEADTTDTTLKHYIIKDSCADDDSADFDVVPTPHRVQFKFQTFKFGQNFDKLYMTCSAIICPPGDNSTACRPLCAFPQHPREASGRAPRLRLSKRGEADAEETAPEAGKPPQSMGGRSDLMMLRNPNVTEDWPLNPTEDVRRVDKNGRIYLLSNKGRLLRCLNCKDK